MDQQLFTHFADFLRAASETELARELERPDRLRLAADIHRGKALEVAYAPFDHMTQGARVVIVGITPGRQQARNALLEARRRLRAGASESDAMAAAKVFASFSGPMRTNLVAMLDAVGLARHLGLPSADVLWGRESRLAQFTSALRYPVFCDGQNYSGSPDILRTPLLRDQLMRWFAPEMAALGDAVFVPLGDKVTEAVEFAAREVGVPEERVLNGMLHPSGSSNERIHFFLGKKPRETLSSKTNPDKILAARAEIERRIAALGRRAA